MDDASKFKYFLREKLKIQPWKIAISRECDLLEEYGDAFKQFCDETSKNETQSTVPSEHKDAPVLQSEPAPTTSLSSQSDQTPHRATSSPPPTENHGSEIFLEDGKHEQSEIVGDKNCQDCIAHRIKELSLSSLFSQDHRSARNLEDFCSDQDIRHITVSPVFSEAEWQEISKHMTFTNKDILSWRKINIALYLRYALQIRQSLGHIPMVHQKSVNLASLLQDIENSI